MPVDSDSNIELEAGGGAEARSEMLNQIAAPLNGVCTQMHRCKQDCGLDSDSDTEPEKEGSAAQPEFASLVHTATQPNTVHKQACGLDSDSDTELQEGGILEAQPKGLQPAGTSTQQMGLGEFLEVSA